VKEPLPEAVIRVLRKHGHEKPELSCQLCRGALIEHAHDQVTRPALRRYAIERRISVEQLVAAMCRLFR
jgi:hypothetical protein